MLTEFEFNFSKHLKGTQRWEPFKFIMLKLEQLGRPVFVVETGTARQIENWAGDGQSTLIWDWLCRRFGCHAYSIDINREAIETAKRQCTSVRLVQDDSIDFLRNMHGAETIDLLYLDAYDWTGNGLSELHHVGELAAIYERLRSGCLIAVDDCHAEKSGKHVLVKAFFDSIQVAPKFSGYITIWQKP